MYAAAVRMRWPVSALPPPRSLGVSGVTGYRSTKREVTMISVHRRILRQRPHQRVFRGDGSDVWSNVGVLHAVDERGARLPSSSRFGSGVDRTICWVLHLAEPAHRDSGKER